MGRGVVVLVFAAAAAVLAQEGPKPKNAIIFVADGLSHGSVNSTDTPALYRVRTEGVYFANSHALFPTQTMPNAAAIATGHYPGDTGQYANRIFISYPLFDRGHFGQQRGSMVPSVEDVLALADINDRFGGNYIREASLVAYARSYGYNTASIGKTGPAALQDLSEVSPVRGRLRSPITIIIEGATGTSGALPLGEGTIAMLKAAGLEPAPPPRDQHEGTTTEPGARAANVEHQKWFADAATKAILPAFAKSPEPFVLVFWSGDPDQTQHAQGDSLNRFSTGIIGATSKAAVRNADRNLGQILEYLDRNPEVRDRTNLFVTSGHGFSTVSRREVDVSGRATTSYAATLRYRDASGRQEFDEGHLPEGFLAIDLARELNLPLFDPEVQVEDEQGAARYARVEPTGAAPTAGTRQRPSTSAALIGGTGRISRPTDARVVVAQSSIYVPDSNRAMVERIVRFLGRQDYVGGIFVHDRFGPMPGALLMSDVGLVGSATTPKPAVVVSFKSYPLDPKDPYMTGVIVGGAGQHNQGDHGALARANTFNNMAAIGPDFKKRFVTRAPVSNADVQPTIARALGMKIPSLGKLRGRVIAEALAGGPATVRYRREVARSRPSAPGDATVLMYQIAEGRIYLDEACFTKAQTCDLR
jgi:arylsulfatase A-like enzyme